MQFHKTTSKIQTEEFRSSFLFFFAAAPTKSNYAIFFIGGEMFAITLRSKESSRIPLLFPRDYEDPLSRVYIRPPETNAKEDAHEGSRGLDWLIYICPNHRHQISGFCRASFFSRFRLALSLKRRSQGRVRQERRDKLPRVKASACIHLYNVSTAIGTIAHFPRGNNSYALLPDLCQ